MKHTSKLFALRWVGLDWTPGNHNLFKNEFLLFSHTLVLLIVYQRRFKTSVQIGYRKIKNNNSLLYSFNLVIHCFLCFFRSFKCVLPCFIFSPNMNLRKNVTANVYPLLTSNLVQNPLQTISKGMSLGHRRKYLGQIYKILL